MQFDGFVVPNARIMHVQSHTFFSRDLTPDSQRILHETRCGIPHLRRIARAAGMSLAVTLNVIRLYLVDNIFDHLTIDLLSDVFAVIAGVKIKMDPQKALGPLQSWRTVSLSARRYGNRSQT